MLRNRRWVRIGIVSLVLGLVVGVGTAYLWRMYQGAGYHLKLAERSYEQGVAALCREDRANATRHFQEALLSAENGTPSEVNAEQLTEAEQVTLRQHAGMGNWLKAKSLRGLALAANKDFTLPPQDGGKLQAAEAAISAYSWNRLTDDKTRSQAIIALRQAALRLPKHVEVQREAVALEIAADPPQWDFSHLVASQLHELEPKDERALYLLARHEYEQPIRVKDTSGSEQTGVMPMIKRSRDRMTKARGYLGELKQLENPVRYRTSFLEAKVAAWLLTHAKLPEQSKPELASKERQILEEILFDAQKGVLTKVAADEAIAKVSRLDLKGVFGLHDLAIDLLIDDSRMIANRENRPYVEAMHRLLDQSMNLANRIAENDKVPERVGEAAEFIAPLVNKVLPYFANDRAELSKNYIQKTIDLCKAAWKNGSADPKLSVHLTNLLLRHEAVAKAPSENRYKEIVGYLQEGIAAAKKLNWPAVRSWPIYEALVRVQINSGVPASDIESSFKALQDAKDPVASSYVAFYSGVLAEREGRLASAKQAWEQCLAINASSDLKRKAMTLIIPIYLSLNEPQKALATVRNLEKHYGKFQRLSSEEQGFLYQAMVSPADLQLCEVKALCGVNQQLLARLKTEQAAVRGDMQKQAQQNDMQLQKVLAKLPATSSQYLSAKVAYIQYLADSERMDLAESELASLKKQLPNDVAVLRLEMELYRVAKAKQPIEETRNELSNLVSNFVRQHPENLAGKLFQAEWLVQVGRTPDALILLQQLASDPKVDSIRVNRLRAVLAAIGGDKKQTEASLSQLPRDPLMDLLWVSAASSAEEQAQRMETTLSKHQSQSIIRCLSAQTAAQRGDDAEAFQQFLPCLENPQTRSMARDGIQPVIMRLAQLDAVALRGYLNIALNKLPSEPVLLWGYAVACLKQGDYGSITTKAEQVKDMATALEACSAACAMHKVGDASTGPWMAAQFWSAADYPERTWPYLRMVLSNKTAALPALTLAVQVAEGNEQLQECQKWIQAARQTDPTRPELMLLEGQLFAKAGQYEYAETVLNKLLAREEKFAPGYGTLFRVMMQQADGMSKASELLRRWQAACPNDVMAQQAEVYLLAKQNKMEAASQLVDQQVAKLSENSSNIQLVSVDSQKKEGRTYLTLTLTQGLIQAKAWPEAESKLKKLLVENPGNAILLAALSDVQLAKIRNCTSLPERENMAKAAESTLWQLYAQRKSDLNIANNLAWLLVKERGETQEAYKILQEATATKPGNLKAVCERLPLEMLDTFGEVFLRLGTTVAPKERKEFFENALRRYPRDPRLHAHLGLAYVQLNEAKLAETSFQNAEKLLATASGEMRERVKGIRGR